MSEHSDLVAHVAALIDDPTLIADLPAREMTTVFMAVSRMRERLAEVERALLARVLRDDEAARRRVATREAPDAVDESRYEDELGCRSVTEQPEPSTRGCGRCGRPSCPGGNACRQAAYRRRARARRDDPVLMAEQIATLERVAVRRRAEAAELEAAAVRGGQRNRNSRGKSAWYCRVLAARALRTAEQLDARAARWRRATP